MKNQYFGDINDYRKYGLLRAIAGPGRLRTAICWALTESDGRTDGARTGYLQDPAEWAHYDPDLFCFLRRHVLGKGRRDVEVLERTSLIPNCSYFTERMPREEQPRDQFFERFLTFASDADLLFFDPDNGLGVKSVPRGSRNSDKYVYVSELQLAFSRGHSLLVYQHFPRSSRNMFINRIAQTVVPALGANLVMSFATSHVVFLLFPQPDHLAELEDVASALEERWTGQVRVGLNEPGRRGSRAGFPSWLCGKEATSAVPPLAAG